MIRVDDVRGSARRSGAGLARIAAASALAALLMAPAASADDDWKFKWSNGFKLESADKAFQLKFGGRLQADFTFVDADPALAGATRGDGVEFRRARFFFEGTVYERVKFKAQYDFAGGDANFRNVYVGLLQDWGEVRFGHYKEYFGLEELTSSKYLAFLERSLNNAFSPGYNSGIGVHGAKGDKVNWGFGAFYDADNFGVSMNEDDVNVTGRVAFRPRYEDDGRSMLHVGLSATRKERASSIRFRSRPEAHFSGRFVDTGTFAANDALVLNLELAGVHDALWWAAEYTQADVSTPVGPDPTFDGYYVQAGYFLGKEGNYRRYKPSAGAFDRQKPASNWLKDGGRGAWEIALRYSTIDLNDGPIFGGEEDNVTLGVNWYPNPVTRLMLNWVHADVDRVGEADFILMRWQVDF